MILSYKTTQNFSFLIFKIWILFSLQDYFWEFEILKKMWVRLVSPACSKLGGIEWKIVANLKANWAIVLDLDSKVKKAKEKKKKKRPTLIYGTFYRSNKFLLFKHYILDL